MAIFDPLVSSLEFAQTSYEDYMKPYAMQEALYQERRKALDEKDEILAKYLPYINDSTPEAKRLYDSAQEQLERNLEQLGRKGWNLNPQPLVDFKRQYRETNSILEKASGELESLLKEDREQKARDGSLMVRYRDKTGRLISPNIDSMISGDYERHVVSGTEVQANAAAAAKALSARTKAAFAKLSRHGGSVGYYQTDTGEFAGVQSGVMMDWLMAPREHGKEIKAYLDTVERIGGAHARENMAGLFNGDFGSAMESVLDRTDYDSMGVEDKLRLNNYLWTGAYQGLSYDEKINLGISPFDNRDRTGGGGHGGGGGTVPVNAAVPKYYQQVYMPEERGDGYDDYQKLKKFFGVSDDDFGATGTLSFPESGVYALVDGLRKFDGSDYSKADSVVSDANVRNAGVKDYISIFDEKGGLINFDDFANKYTPIYKEINSFDYLKKQSDNGDYGNLYKEYIRDLPAAYGKHVLPRAIPNNIPEYRDDSDREIKAMVRSQYDQTIEAVLAAFGASQDVREKIRKDTSGKLFDNFVKENNVNEATFKNKMIDMADTYANIDATMRYANFASNNKEIATDVLKLCRKSGVDGDGNVTYRLNLVRDENPYTFKNVMKEDTIEEESRDANGNPVKAQHRLQYKDKELKVNTNYKEEVNEKELFPKGNYDCLYIVPPDPEQGVIVQFPGGQKALISPKELGSLYDKDKISEMSKMIKDARRNKEITIAEMQRLNTDLYNYKQEGHSEAEVRALAEKMVEAQSQLASAYKSFCDAELRFISEITELFKNNISTIYKPNTQG